MSHPLGSRYLRPAQRAKKITLKPPTDQYFVNVSIPPHVAEEDEPGASNFNGAASMSYEQSTVGGGSHRGSIYGGGQSPAGSAFSFASQALRGNGNDYAASAVNAIPVHLHVRDSVSEAIAKIVARFREVSGQELPRPASSYMLCRCFADYSVDFSQRALHGDSTRPLVDCIEFPYFLSLQVNPYQQRRDVVVFEQEPQGRQAIREQRRVQVLFALGYAEMLRKMHQQYRFLLGRDADNRRQKKDLEIQARHDVELRIAIVGERNGRQAVADEEAGDWARVSFAARALWDHVCMLQAQWAYSDRELGAANRRILGYLATERRCDVLDARFADLVGRLLPLALDASMRSQREAYTEARVAVAVKYAREVDVDVDIMDARRVLVGKRRHPELYTLSDGVVNPLTINRDVYTSARSLV